MHTVANKDKDTHTMGKKQRKLKKKIKYHEGFCRCREKLQHNTLLTLDHILLSLGECSVNSMLRMEQDGRPLVGQVLSHSPPVYHGRSREASPLIDLM